MAKGVVEYLRKLPSVLNNQITQNKIITTNRLGSYGVWWRASFASAFKTESMSRNQKDKFDSFSAGTGVNSQSTHKNIFDTFGFNLINIFNYPLALIQATSLTITHTVDIIDAKIADTRKSSYLAQAVKAIFVIPLKLAELPCFICAKGGDWLRQGVIKAANVLTRHFSRPAKKPEQIELIDISRSSQSAVTTKPQGTEQAIASKTLPTTKKMDTRMKVATTATIATAAALGGGAAAIVVAKLALALKAKLAIDAAAAVSSAAVAKKRYGLFAAKKQPGAPLSAEQVNSPKL